MPGQSLWVQSITPADARLASAGLLATNSTDPGDIRQGVLYTGQQAVIGATSDLHVSVLPLHFVGSKAYNNGAYLGFNPAVTYPAVPAAPALGSKRIDVLYVVQQDANALVSADGTTAAVFGVKQGVAGSSPSKPALTDAPAAPVGAVEIGTITWDSTTGVPTATNAAVAGASCTLATTCAWTTTRGNAIPVRNQAERDALTPGDGWRVYRFDVHRIETYNSFGWAYQSRMQPGVHSGTTDVNGYDTINHGAPYTPSVVTGTLTEGVQWQVDNITATTFRLRVLTSAGAVNASHGYTFMFLAAE